MIIVSYSGTLMVFTGDDIRKWSGDPSEMRPFDLERNARIKPSYIIDMADIKLVLKEPVKYDWMKHNEVVS